MKVIRVKNYEEMSRTASEILIGEIRKKKNIVVGFATGRTPLGLYKNLVRAYRKREVDFSGVRSFNLDEYYPVAKNSRRSFFSYMFRNLFGLVNIKEGNMNFLDGEVRDWRAECARYEGLIRKSPIDVQILGVGVNGHIGFNEPGSSFSSRTRLVELSDETRRQNSGIFWRAPKQALTMGVGTILSAKKIILLASGREKMKAVERLVKGKISKDCPVSFLRGHKDLVVVTDSF
ncbi:MAG: glucosamine-6-phosphate deaminase [archaeon]